MQGHAQSPENRSDTDHLESVAPGVSLLDSILLFLAPEQRQHFLESAGIEGVVYANRAPTFDKPIAIKINRSRFRDLLESIGCPARELAPRQWDCDYDDPSPLVILKKDLEAGVRLSPPPRDWFANHPEGDHVPIRIESKRFGIPCRVRPHVHGGSAYLEAMALELSDFSRSSVSTDVEDAEAAEEVLDDPVDISQLSSVVSLRASDGSGSSTSEFAPHIRTDWEVLGPNSSLSPAFDRVALSRSVSQLVASGRNSAISRATRERCEMLEGLIRLKLFASQYPYTLANQSGDTFEFQVEAPPKALAKIKRAYVYRDMEGGTRRDRVDGILLERIGQRNQREVFRVPEGFQCDSPPISGYLVDTGDVSQLQKQLDSLRDLRHPNSRPHLLRLGNLLGSESGGLGEPGSWESIPIRLIDDKLTERQADAVRKALATPDVCLIQGPPGTGKTRVISEIVRQAAQKNWKVLLVAPTHSAVDNVLERIGIQEDVSPVRCVTQAKLEDLPAHIQEFTYDRRSSLLAKETGRRSELDRAEWQSRTLKLESAVVTLKQCVEQGAAADQIEREVNELRAALSRGPQLAQSGFASETQPAVDAEEATAANTMDALKKLVAMRVWELEKANGEYAHVQNSIDNLARKIENANTHAQGLTDAQAKALPLRLLNGSWWGSFFTDYERTASESANRIAVLQQQCPALQTRIRERERSLKEAQEKSLAAIAAKEREVTAARERFATSIASLSDVLPTPPTFDAASVNTGIRQLTAEQEQAQGRLALLEEWTQYLGRESENLKNRLAEYVNLVCATTVGIATDEYFGDKGAFVEKQFDLLVVDEAGKVTETEFLVAATRAKRWVLVGDHKQLPPYYDQILDPYLHEVNKALQAADKPPLDAQALRQSIFERLWHKLNPAEVHANQDASAKRDFTEAISEDPSGAPDAAYDYAEKSALMWRGRQVTQAWDGKHREKQLDEMWLQQRISQEGNLPQSLPGRQSQVASVKPESIGASRCVTLDVQRRMHPDLAVFVSEMFYDGRYYSPDGDAYLQSKTLKLVHFPKPVTFIDICPGRGADGYEVDLSKRDQRKRYLAEHSSDLPEQGYANPREAEQVIQVLEAIANDAALQREHAELGQTGDQVPVVGIIALYAGQVALIHKLIGLSGTLRGERVSGSDWLCGGMRVTVNTVDAFQGKECPVIILSFTRSNHRQAVGFVDDSNRLNVALSRARKKLILVGDTETLTRRAREQAGVNKDSRAAGKERECFVQLVRYVEGRGKTMRVFERRIVS